MKNSKQTVKIVTTIVVCITAVLFVVLLFQFAKIVSLKTKQSHLNTTIEQTQKQIAEYDELLDYINFKDGEYSQEFLEDYAREVYGWGKPGRTYYTNK